MTIEEYMKMSSSEQLSYRLSLSNEQRDELQKSAMRYLFKQNFTETQDEILELCEDTKQKHKCSWVDTAEDAAGRVEAHVIAQT